MFSKWYQSSLFKVAAVFSLLLLCGLALTSSAKATPSPVINTDDGAIDGGWGAPFYTSTCSNSGIPDQNEIEAAWVQSWQTNGGNDGEVYFRLQTCTGPSFTSNIIGAAVMDCDRNLTTNTIYDRKVTFNAASDYIAILDGTNYFLGTQCETSVCPFGERMNDTSEWRIDYTTIANAAGSPFPPGCRDAINIAFATANRSSGAVSDQTPLIGWNVPTAVEVKQIKAYSQPISDYIALGALGLFVVFGLGAVIIYRRKQA